jgi:hypothetical protein
LFLSRGDNSGTHAKEKALWKVAGVKAEGERWYQETGLGMGQTLNVAAEKKGYTLTDRGTYLALAKNLKLDILVEGDAVLLNIYHVMEVNPQKWPKVNIEAAKAFADFMVSKEAQEVIRTFGVDKYGSPLFFPDAGKKVEDLGKYDGSDRRWHHKGLLAPGQLRSGGAWDHPAFHQGVGKRHLDQPGSSEYRWGQRLPSPDFRAGGLW